MNEFTKGPGEKYCKDCGAVIDARAEICPKCGVRQLPVPSVLGGVAPNGRSRIIAALLAFFLGGFGIHKFYLGQTGWGIVYLVFCWTFIPSIVALVEFVFLLIMSDDEFNQKYGRN